VPLAWLFEMIWPTIYRSNIKNLISSGVGLNDSLGRARIE
jgi:peptide/nickel transport system substrate-binding protein